MENIELSTKVAEHDIRIHNLEESLHEIKDIRSGINELRLVTESLSKDVENLLESLKLIREYQKDDHKRLKALEDEPKHQWNSMTRTVFTSIVSVIAGALASGALVLLQMSKNP